MESEHLERATPDDRNGLVGAVAPTRTPLNSDVAAVWTARVEPRRHRTVADDPWPRTRRHKATRCRHCAFCHPPGNVGAVRACTHPDHADLVVGDQMACGSFSPFMASPAST